MQKNITAYLKVTAAGPIKWIPVAEMVLICQTMMELAIWGTIGIYIQ